MSPKTYTTREAAKAVGITRATLQSWISSGKVKAPKPRLRNGVGVRVWTQSDVARLGRVKEKIYRKGRGRKKKSKA
jgi:excisionase family DNA binding protein